MIEKLVMEIQPGASINDAAGRAQTIADWANVEVWFDFNGVDCIATPRGDATLLVERQQTQQNRKPRVNSQRHPSRAVGDGWAVF